MRIGAYITKQYPIEYYDTRTMGIRWLNIMQRYSKKILADYKKTVETWDRKPIFKKEYSYSGAKPRFAVYTDSDIYFQIDEGTDVRYDTMTPDFQPKTKPGVIGSFSGEGGFAYRDPRITRPGIEPREFSFIITMKYEKEIQDALDRATERGLAQRKKS